MKKLFLVTGGAGYIGSHMTNLLIEKGHKVIIVDNLSDDGSREYLLDQPDVVLYSADTDYNKSHYGVLWQQAILSNHCLNKWVLMADADEFLIYPGSETNDISTYLNQIEKYFHLF